MKKEKIMIIDGSSLLFRAFYALPLLSTKEGIYTNAMYGFLSMIYKALDENKPDYISVAFDKSGPTFRTEMYEEYKGHRTSPPSEIKQQFPMIKEILEAMNIHYLEYDRYEADDIAGSLTSMAQKLGLKTILLTGDRDYLQLADDDVDVVITKKGISETELYNRSKILEEYGITPEQIIDLKGLMGDSSDNIPGVPGIGKVTGLKLIQEFGSLENLYKNIDKVRGPKRKENLINNEDLAYLSRDLGRIYREIDLDLDLEELKLREVNVELLVPLLEKYEFSIFLEKYIDDYKPEEIEKEAYKYLLLEGDFTSIKKKIWQEKLFSFKFIISNANIMEDEILYLGLKTRESEYKIVDIKNYKDQFVKEFREIFENEEIKKIGHNVKEDIIILFRLGIELRGLVFDSMIGQYLLNPSQSTYSINDISLEYLKYYGKDLDEILGKGKKRKTFKEVERDILGEYICMNLSIPLKVKDKMVELIEEQSMENLFYKIEMPLVKVLANMEFEGFKIDKEELKKLEVEYKEEINSLRDKIYKLAGREFNINSPKQLGIVLFEDLELPIIKRTKTGYSTNAEVLDKLKSEHDIIEEVLKYRELAKLKSTYIDGLLKIVNPNTGRIHSTFNQTITTTGRISSTEPNLQNIPIRTENGRKIRRAFVAKEDYKLVDGDYSQIELRVLAHISEDEKMIEGFKNDMDIHSKTASEVFDIPIDRMTPEIRDKAKAVNFGIIYGISDYGLSQDLNISRKEAKEYIDNYLKNFNKVKEYMESTIEYGKEYGYVETILNRRRYIPELKAKNFNIRSFGERVALNTPIQGSAADIIKMAMVKVYEELKTRGLKSKLILQVHDELIIETYKNELKEVKSIMKKVMESIIKLKVPLKVDIKIGENWYETM